MAITRSFGNGFEVQDFTGEINLIPNNWGTIGQIGLFEEIPVAEHTVVFDEIVSTTAVLVDRIRGVRANQNNDAVRKTHTAAIPHFPFDDAILPQDIQGKRAYGTAADAEQLDLVRARKMIRLRQSHANTLEIGRALAITSGGVYAPNGTVSQNWYTEMGVTQTVVDFLFGTSTSDCLGNVEKCIAYIQDNTGLTSMTGVVAMTSPVFFAKLIAHPMVKTAYQYYSSTQQPLRDRLSAGGSPVPFHRTFDFGGVHFIEMRDSFGGTPLIPSGDAYFVPLGTNGVFKTHFSPANRFGLVNTLGEQVYMFESQALNGTSITLETESNWINTVLKPGIVIRGTSST